MKKKIWICIAGVVLLAILFVPIPSGTYKDGGTRAYSALTYKIVKWQRDTGSDVYKALCFQKSDGIGNGCQRGEMLKIFSGQKLPSHTANLGRCTAVG